MGDWIESEQLSSPDRFHRDTVGRAQIGTGGRGKGRLALSLEHSVASPSRAHTLTLLQTCRWHGHHASVHGNHIVCTKIAIGNASYFWKLFSSKRYNTQLCIRMLDASSKIPEQNKKKKRDKWKITRVFFSQEKKYWEAGNLCKSLNLISILIALLSRTNNQNIKNLWFLF